MDEADLFQGNFAKNGDHFIIEDLLDFPNDDNDDDDGIPTEHAFDVSAPRASTDSSSFAALPDTSCNSSSFSSIGDCRSFTDHHFPNTELYVPYGDLAELEWMSNFVEESFSSEDLQRMQLIQGMKARNDGVPETRLYEFQPETATAASAANASPVLKPETSVVPAKARSKRSRAAPGNWASRLLLVSPTPPEAATVLPLDSDISIKKTVKKRESSPGNEGRKCLHCATDKTPQWRTGPMGPKTLCNACGVRYKSGRLVPEYRPAASPTFVLTKHSNSHRKVLELRRQKELLRAQQHQQFLHHHNVMFDISNGEDYLIHQYIGPDYSQLI